MGGLYAVPQHQARCCTLWWYAQSIGRVLAERDQPPFARVTMDGIAIAHSAFAAGKRRFPIQGTQAAGATPSSLGATDGCIEVMTGAVLPAGFLWSAAQPASASPHSAIQSSLVMKCLRKKGSLDLRKVHS